MTDDMTADQREDYRELRDSYRHKVSVDDDAFRAAYELGRRHEREERCDWKPQISGQEIVPLSVDESMRYEIVGPITWRLHVETATERSLWEEVERLRQRRIDEGGDVPEASKRGLPTREELEQAVGIAWSFGCAEVVQDVCVLLGIEAHDCVGPPEASRRTLPTREELSDFIRDWTEVRAVCLPYGEMAYLREQLCDLLGIEDAQGEESDDGGEIVRRRNSGFHRMGGGGLDDAEVGEQCPTCGGKMYYPTQCDDCLDCPTIEYHAMCDCETCGGRGEVIAEDGDEPFPCPECQHELRAEVERLRLQLGNAKARIEMLQNEAPDTAPSEGVEALDVAECMTASCRLAPTTVERLQNAARKMCNEAVRRTEQRMQRRIAELEKQLAEQAKPKVTRGAIHRWTLDWQIEDDRAATDDLCELLGIGDDT